jgi:PiT family inorganic phosphate transporter
MAAVVGESLAPGTFALLVFTIGIALAFEFVNGFHDTANAVATVIYTKSLRPRWAVIWSGLCNFCGAWFGGTAVAFGIISLLPMEMLTGFQSHHGLAMVLALLFAAIAWNLGTWYVGLPSSSSHTLIGAILGAGFTHSVLEGHAGQGVNWSKAGEVGLSLLLSPLLGFVLAALLLLACRALIRNPALYEPADTDQPPPPWIRGTLLLTCTGVSLAHGSNDGQKGVGLVMLILIAFLPKEHLLDTRADTGRIADAANSAGVLERYLGTGSRAETTALTVRELASLRATFETGRVPDEFSLDERQAIRGKILRADRAVSARLRQDRANLSADEHSELDSHRRQLTALTEYTPRWVIVAVALALGLGTTIGWKRIVVTVGEKIGKSHLSYAQGACAEVVAMCTIGLADTSGLPVSTTHVLSSGIAGTMAANRSGLQFKTVRNILLAWVFTLPVSMLLSSVLYLLFRTIYSAS